MAKPLLSVIVVSAFCEASALGSDEHLHQAITQLEGQVQPTVPEGKVWTYSAKVFTDAECSNLGGWSGNLAFCQAKCTATAGCTAFNIDKPGLSCVLRGCSFPVVPAQNPNDCCISYYLEPTTTTSTTSKTATTTSSPTTTISTTSKTATTTSSGCSWQQNNGVSSPGWALGTEGYNWNLDSAKTICVLLGPSVCKAVTCAGGSCGVRAGSSLPSSSDGEVTWVPNLACYQACSWQPQTNTNSLGWAGGVIGSQFDLAGAVTKCKQLGSSTCKAVTCDKSAGLNCGVRAGSSANGSPSGETTYWPQNTNCYQVCPKMIRKDNIVPSDKMNNLMDANSLKANCGWECPQKLGMVTEWDICMLRDGMGAKGTGYAGSIERAYETGFNCYIIDDCSQR